MNKNIIKKHLYWGVDFDNLLAKVERCYQNNGCYIQINCDYALIREPESDAWQFYDVIDGEILGPCSKISRRIKTLDDLIRAYKNRYYDN